VVTASFRWTSAREGAVPDRAVQQERHSLAEELRMAGTAASDQDETDALRRSGRCG
jgi:hypothetical protein